MLRWGMEMILHSVELGFLDVLIEQADGLGLEPTLLLLFWQIVVVKSVVEGVASLVELEGLILGDFHLFVVELEGVILEIFFDLDSRAEIDWGLRSSKLANLW